MTGDYEGILQPVVLFGLLLASMVISGGIDARVSSRHAAVKERLGSLVHLGSSLSESARHGARWLWFLFVGHFALRDPLLSALCICVAALWLGVVSLLLGLWSVGGS